MKVKRFIFVLVALGLFGVVGIVVAELGLRVLGVSHPIFHRVDPELGMSLIPGISGMQTNEGEAFVSINSHGFHDIEREIAKPANTIRVAVLGDSYTEAAQVDREENFCAVIEKTLNASDSLKGQRVEVLNFGVSGYGTTQELLLLRKKVVEYSPDVVVLAFLTGNDLRNNSKALESSPRPFFVRSEEGYTLDMSFKDSEFYKRRSSLSARMFVGAATLSRVIQVANRFRQSRRTQAEVAATKARGTGEAGLDDTIYREPSGEDWIEAWNVTEYVLSQFAIDVKKMGAVPLVVTLSNGIQVNPNEAVRQETLELLQVEDLLYPDRRIHEHCVKQGIASVMLAPKLLEYVREHKISLHGFEGPTVSSGHWNPDGHRVAGEIISQEVLRLLSEADTSVSTGDE